MTENPSPDTPARNLVTIAQAAAEVDRTPGAVRNWIVKGFVYAERIATGKYLVDLDDVRALRRQFHPVIDPNDVGSAPPLSEDQIHRLRTLLHATPQGGNR